MIGTYFKPLGAQAGVRPNAWKTRVVAKAATIDLSLEMPSSWTRLLLICVLVPLGLPWQSDKAFAAEAGSEAAAEAVDEETAVAALKRIGVRLAFNRAGRVNFVDASDRSDGRFADAEMVYIAALPELESLDLNRTEVTDQGVAQIRGMPKLSSLGLCPRCTDAVIAHLETLPRLRQLRFPPTAAITPEGVQQIGQLTKLTMLSLPWGSGLTEDSLGRLKELTQLIHLGLSDRVTDRGMAYLRQFAHLRFLQIGNCTRVTDAGLRHAAELRELQAISLPPRITDRGLAHLAGLPNVRELVLHHTAVTDAGLQVVRGMKKLRYLALPEAATDASLVHLQGLPLQYLCHSGTNITDEGIQRLKEHLPDLQVLVGKARRIPLLPLEEEEPPAEDPAAVAALRALGAATLGYNHAGRVRCVANLHAAGSRFTDKEMALLARLPDLDAVGLSGTAVTDRGIASLEGWANLKDLTLPENCTVESLRTASTLPNLRRLSVCFKPTPEALAQINKMTNLESLCIPFYLGLHEEYLLQLKDLTNLRSISLPADLSDEGMGYLTQFPKLRGLNLRGCRGVTDAGLVHLEKLSEITNLGLPPACTDEGLKHILGMNRLRLLDLRCAQVTDEGLKLLHDMTSLQMLTLPQGATDVGLEHLRGLDDLMTLNYPSNDGVTQQGIARLNLALPECKCLYYTPRKNR